MAVAMKLSDDLIEDAKTVAAAEHRSVPKQIEYWARIGKAVLDNPDLLADDSGHDACPLKRRKLVMSRPTSSDKPWC